MALQRAARATRCADSGGPRIADKLGEHVCNPDTANPKSLQAKLIARRFGFEPPIARLVASLAFSEARI
jgi:hypothetical protein